MGETFAQINQGEIASIFEPFVLFCGKSTAVFRFKAGRRGSAAQTVSGPAPALSVCRWPAARSHHHFRGGRNPVAGAGGAHHIGLGNIGHARREGGEGVAGHRGLRRLQHHRGRAPPDDCRMVADYDRSGFDH